MTPNDFQDPGVVREIADSIARKALSRKRYSLMEVCGTHTQTIGKWALRGMLPENLRLVSGPGCPVCVTPGGYIDQACRLALEYDAVIVTFGDLIRVPGEKTSLEQARAMGGDIRVVYSAFDALKIAKSTDRQTVFLAIGFETTIAGIAATIETASVAGIKNLSFMTALKTVPPALDALISDPDVEIDGFILPGHVSAIIGSTPYDYIPGRGISGAICGFEPVDVLLAIDFLLDAINSGRHSIKNLYPRAVKDAGNQKALDLFKKVFDSSNAVWRGIGTIPDSGLVLKDDYLEKFDASLRFNLPEVESETAKGCQCGAVLKGQITPDKCPLFGNMCTPDHPVGPCMVSGEGSCAAYYRYGG